MKDFLKPKEQLLEELGSDPQTGLTGAQAEESLARHGANVLTRQNQDSLRKRIAEAAAEPMILMLIAAGLIALVAISDPLRGEVYDAVRSCRELHQESIFTHLMKNKPMLSVAGCRS